jgi:hypothetical protein
MKEKVQRCSETLIADDSYNISTISVYKKESRDLYSGENETLLLEKANTGYIVSCKYNFEDYITHAHGI